MVDRLFSIVRNKTPVIVIQDQTSSPVDGRAMQNGKAARMVNALRRRG